MILQPSSLWSWKFSPYPTVFPPPLPLTSTHAQTSYLQTGGSFFLVTPLTLPHVGRPGPTDKLDISVSNSEDIINTFLSLAINYGWGSLSFVVGTATGAKNIFRLVEQIQLADMQIQAFGYFVLQGIVNTN